MPYCGTIPLHPLAAKAGSPVYAALDTFVAAHLGYAMRSADRTQCGFPIILRAAIGTHAQGHVAPYFTPKVKIEFRRQEASSQHCESCPHFFFSRFGVWVPKKETAVQPDLVKWTNRWASAKHEAAKLEDVEPTM